MAYPNEQNIGDDELPNSISGWIKYIDKKLTPSEKPPTTSLYGLAKGLPLDEEGRKIEQQTLKQMEGFGEGVSDYTERQVEELKTKPLEALAKGFGYSGATGLGKAAVAGRVGTAVAGAATPLMGPYAVIPGVIAGGAAYYGLGQAQQAIEPEPIKQLRQEVPTTMATSEFVGAMAQPLVKMPKFTPKTIPAAPTISGTPALTERPMIEMIKGSGGVYRPQTAFDIFKENVSGRIRSAAGKVSSLPPEEVYGLAKDAIKFGTQSFDEFRTLAKVNQLGLPEEVLKNAFTQAVASSLKTPETIETPKPTTLPTADQVVKPTKAPRLEETPQETGAKKYASSLLKEGRSKDFSRVMYYDVDNGAVVTTDGFTLMVSPMKLTGENRSLILYDIPEKGYRAGDVVESSEFPLPPYKKIIDAIKTDKSLSVNLQDALDLSSKVKKLNNILGYDTNSIDVNGKQINSKNFKVLIDGLKSSGAKELTIKTGDSPFVLIEGDNGSRGYIRKLDPNFVSEHIKYLPEDVKQKVIQGSGVYKLDGTSTKEFKVSKTKIKQEQDIEKKKNQAKTQAPRVEETSKIEPPKVEVPKTKMPTADVIPKQKQNVLVDDRGYVISDSADLTDPTNAKYILKSKKLGTDKYNEWLVTKDGRKYINEKDPVKAIKILEDNGMFPFSERSYTDTIEGIENTLEGRLKELGYKVKVKGSNLSNSSYLFVDDPYQNIDGFKIRLSDHELPPTYDRINGVPEFEISPKSNQHNYTQYTDPQKLIDKIQKDYPLSTVEATPTEPIATQPPVRPPSEPPVTPPSEPPIQKPKRPEDIQPTWTLGERSRMNVVNVNFGDDAEILGRVNRKVFGEKLPPEDQDMKLAFEQNRQKLNATKENTERTLAQGIYDQAKNSELVKPGQSFGSFEQEFNEFLHYNHATARNAKNAEILNEKGEPVTTSGSGLTDENVSEYFSKLDPKKREAFQSIYNEQIKPILKGELEALKNAGKINEESFTNLNRYIDEGNYVPLVRDFANAPDYAKPLVKKKSGSGAKIVASKGSQLEVDNPLANILIKSNRAAETLAKEETKRTAYRLFVNNPNPEVAVVVDPTTRVETKNRLEAMGLEEKQMESILDGIYGSDVEYVYINPKTNKAYGKEELAQIKKNDPELFESLDKEKRLIYEREKLNGYDNVVPVNIEGKNSYIVFNPKAPEGQGQEIADLLNGKVEQYKELAILKYSGLVNNYLSALYTKYTPAFAYRNLPRDWQGAAVQINKTPLVGKSDEVAGNATAAIPTIASESYKMLKFGTLKPNPNDPTSVLFGQFVEDGGYLSYTKLLQDSTQTTKSLVDKLNKISKSDTKLGMVTGGSYNPFTWLYESIIGPMNNVSELSLRFGAYKTALDNGFSRDRATQISRDISLNLARSGKIIKNELKGFELFLGPRIAGAKQFGGFTTKGGQKLLVDLMALGVLQQALFDITGESDNKQLNRLSENGNVVIPTGHDDDGNANYVKFPLSEIFDVPMQFGRSSYRGTRNVQKDQQALLTALWNETGAVSKKVYGAIPLAPSLDFMNIRGAGTFGPVPSAFEPIVNALRNRDTFTGLPISPKVYDDTVPGYQRSSIKSSLTAKAIAEAINKSTGGTRNVAGRLSPTADQIDYVVKGYAGPFYSIPKQIAEAFPQNKLTSYVFRNMNQENDWRKLPILNIFLGKATEQKEQEIRYYENLERFAGHSTELGVERKEDRPDMKQYISDYVSRNPDAKIADPSTSYSVTNDLKDAVKEVTEANREIREIAKSEEYKENPDKFINNIEKLNQKIYKNQSKFNRAYQRVIDRYGTE